MTDATPKRARLTHYVVQAHFVVDDGDKLTRKRIDPVEVDADEIDAFLAEKLPASLAKFETELNGGDA
ncbi:hypothetical protein [Pseudoclavibacter sp. RFBA6]|uniref:hypothetical protein n=1 Tax=Pseudoclavibacter sp. RFBA6 TaxID=2080573 RepID=UPI000CE86921|nr:hypothetical protein [Pseudoclavibacter sp. RFBA6]PPG39474.1 hypothetical protein C5C17_11835 [Pseudoclavibacter sp. RFBA6]